MPSTAASVTASQLGQTEEEFSKCARSRSGSRFYDRPRVETPSSRVSTSRSIGASRLGRSEEELADLSRKRRARSPPPTITPVSETARRRQRIDRRIDDISALLRDTTPEPQPKTDFMALMLAQQQRDAEWRREERLEREERDRKERMKREERGRREWKGKRGREKSELSGRRGRESRKKYL
ncbi:hypothetical protein PsorP6_014402 [Peronosclerospora sorghi]|uniref:Uncharacterized protein n=1 Tax=Peronosclerospora sorghi TaxID=230839 RepID=A0ACC0VG75_9STRA|nr:hypothetical protein PsorP6_014402 [Peronosclerospora sorghi]